MEKKTGLAIAALLIISIVAAGAYAIGFGGKGMFAGNDKVKAAIESGDYSAYTTAAESASKAKELTLEQFNNLVQKYKAEAPMIQARKNAEQAIKNSDYTAWSGAMNSLIEYQKARITQQNFDSIVKMHQQMQSNNSTMMHKGKGFGKGRFFHAGHMDE